MPKISVIIPCFNQAEYLKDSVCSVLSQTFQDFEIIIVDDGSDIEEQIKILDDFKAPKTKLIRRANHGVDKTRNFAINEANGTYILPLDADDKIAPEYLKKAFNILEKNPKIGIVYCKAEYFGTKSGTMPLPKYNFPNLLIQPQIFITSLFRKSDWQIIGGFSTDMIYGWEDYEFWLSIHELGKIAYQIPEILFYYRQHKLSRKDLATDHIISNFAKLFRKHQKLYSDNIESLFEAIMLGRRPLLLKSTNQAEASFYCLSRSIKNEQTLQKIIYPLDEIYEIEFFLKEFGKKDLRDYSLRLDLMDFAGLIHLYSVQFINTQTNQIVQESKAPYFRGLKISGTSIEWFRNIKKMIILSAGDDPQIKIIALPKNIESNNLKIRVRFKSQKFNLKLNELVKEKPWYSFFLNLPRLFNH